MQGNEEGLGKKPPVPSSSNQELRCGASFKEFSLYLKGNEKSWNHSSQEYDTCRFVFQKFIEAEWLRTEPKGNARILMKSEEGKSEEKKPQIYVSVCFFINLEFKLRNVHVLWSFMSQNIKY